MAYLIFAILIWAFSFSLIGTMLQNVDPFFSAFLRSLFALCCFLPLVRIKRNEFKKLIGLFLIGGIQLGAMYCFYFSAFNYLSVTEILLFTIATPLYICLVRDIFKRQFHITSLMYVLLSVIGAAIVRYGPLNSTFFIGFVLIQMANICFAIGQYAYSLLEYHQQHQHQRFFTFYLGATVISGIAYMIVGQPVLLTKTQFLLLIYLGVIASGLGYFLWNKGATIVETTSIAIMHQMLIPVGIVVNILFFNGQVHFIKLFLGGSLIGLALFLSIKNDQYKTMNY